MKTAKIELQGSNGNAAVLTRQPGAEDIHVEIIPWRSVGKRYKHDTQKLVVNAYDKAGLAGMAKRLAETLGSSEGEEDGICQVTEALSLLTR